MKIGILTYHRAENYGALLQAYATMTYLRSLGHEVSFVDYWPKYHSDYFKIFPSERFRKGTVRVKIGLLNRFLLWGLLKYIRKRNLRNFMKEKLGLGERPIYVSSKEQTAKYDAVVYGSDQIWRKQHLGGVGFDEWYFGSENVNAKLKIAYAGSMGAIESDESDKAFIKRMMKNFAYISVRESDLSTYLNSLSIPSSVVIDPVFLLTREQWREIEEPVKKNKKYILFYNLLNSPESTAFAESLSNKTGLPIIEINKELSLKHLGKRYVSTAPVGRFLSLIDGAEYVVSNSFHGVAFSLIFHKEFYAVGMSRKANRVISLLNIAGIGDRYVAEGALLELGKSIDYRVVDANTKKIIDFSKQFLYNITK